MAKVDRYERLKVLDKVSRTMVLVPAGVSGTLASIEPMRVYHSLRHARRCTSSTHPAREWLERRERL